MRQKRIKFERVTATQVFHFMISNKMIQFENDNEAILSSRITSSSISSVQRYLLRNGFKRGNGSTVNVYQDHII